MKNRNVKLQLFAMNNKNEPIEQMSLMEDVFSDDVDEMMRKIETIFNMYIALTLDEKSVRTCSGLFIRDYGWGSEWVIWGNGTYWFSSKSYLTPFYSFDGKNIINLL